MTNRVRQIDWARWLHTALLAVSAIWIVGYFFPPLNHDTSALLYIAKAWMEGGTLYVDNIDINTPLVFALHVIPEALAKLTGLQGTTMTVVCLAVAIAVSFLACRQVLAARLDPTQATTDALLPLLILFILAVFPNQTFTQREHLMLVLAMPYFLVASGRAQEEVLTRRLLIGSALMAGLGFAMKPYFLGMPALVEAYLLVRRGWRTALADPSPWCMLAVGVGHALFAVFVTPEYFKIVLPIAIEFYTEVSIWSYFDLVVNGHLGPPALFLPVLGIAAFVAIRSEMARVFALAALGALISGFAQRKGLIYQALPAQALTLMLAVIIIAHVLDNQMWPRARNQAKNAPKLFAGALMILLFYQECLHTRPFFKQLEYAGSDVERLGQVVRKEAWNGKILVLSPGIYPFFPMLNYTNVHMTMRFETLWVLQGVYANCQELASLYNPPETMSPAESFVFRSVAEDFYNKKPALLIVDKVPGIPRCQSGEFHYLTYFQRNPLFAKRFEEYVPLMEMGRYTIYKRPEPAKVR